MFPSRVTGQVPEAPSTSLTPRASSMASRAQLLSTVSLATFHRVSRGFPGRWRPNSVRRRYLHICGFSRGFVLTWAAGPLPQSIAADAALKITRLDQSDGVYYPTFAYHCLTEISRCFQGFYRGRGPVTTVRRARFHALVAGFTHINILAQD